MNTIKPGVWYDEINDELFVVKYFYKSVIPGNFCILCWFSDGVCFGFRDTDKTSDVFIGEW